VPQPKRSKVRNVVRFVTESVWHIEPNLLNSMVEVLELRQNGFEFTEAEVAERIAAAAGGKPLDQNYGESGPMLFDNVAVIPIQGVMAARMNMFMRISGGTSTQQVGAWVKELKANSAVDTVILDVDSGGGEAKGNEELVMILDDLKQSKRVVSVVTGMAASAAYYVASAAETIVMTPSSEVGSIGTYRIHTDTTGAQEKNGKKFTIIRAGENKILGNDLEPLTEKAMAVAQEHIDGHYQMFVAAVAKNRGVTPDHVLKNFGQGKLYLAKSAIELGMADEQGTLDDTVAKYRRQSSNGTAGSSLGNSLIRGETVNPKLLAFLKTTGAVSENSTEQEQEAALRIACAVSGVNLAENWKDSQEETLASLQKTMLARLGENALQLDRSQFTQLATIVEGGTGQSQTADQSNGESGSQMSAAQLAKLEAQVAKRERARIDDLEARAQILGVSDELLSEAKDSGMSVEKAVMKWTDELAKNEQSFSTGHSNGDQIKFGAAALEKFDAAATEALTVMLGVDGLSDKEPSAAAQALQHKPLIYFAEESMRMQGNRCDGKIPEEIAAAAMQMTGDIIIRNGQSSFNRPGTFPSLMSNLANKMLLGADSYSPATYKQWTYKLSDARDFKPKTIHQLGEFGELPHVPDGDDFEESTMSENTAWIQTDKYGDEFRLTPVMIANDELDGLKSALEDKNIAHEQTLNRLCVNLLTGNVPLSDGYNLFDNTNHANDLTTGDAPDDDELAAMRLKLRKQLGISGKRNLNYNLKKLLIPSDLETGADKLLGASNVVPVTSANVPAFKQKVTPIVEPMLDADSITKYYGLEEPRISKSIVYCHQMGFGRMRIRIYYNPRNGCLHYQFEGRFAAAVRDHRGIVRNAGTGGG
jgi:signal peptide peptidase SppA